ncbi:hypothetical protein OG792_25575 [Micromonospora sp. NBC_01699]|uniref:hypothetical protein n=1 Tax=Micromonospora sp. NBC_01699 TaxID=2975984 RepID=UPI002E2C4683|nr:hypothetical protein [Micromonospora sp. NBC_01699]
MTGVARLDESVPALLAEALALYRDDPRATERLRHYLDRFHEPLRIAVAGPWRAGKSTLLNAILGEEVAPVEPADGGPLHTWYEDGPEPGATAYSAEGSAWELPVIRSTGALRVELGGWRSTQVSEVVVRWPTRVLRHTTLMEMPAVAPTAPDEDQPTAMKIIRDADAVLYLTRDGRETDLRFLRALREGAVGRSAPVNVLLVLARADELGGGRVDALVTAKQLARRQYQEPGVRPLCMGVVPVAGLVALAGRVLGEAEYAALAALAELPRDELTAALLSADRFVNTAFTARGGSHAAADYSDSTLPDAAVRRALLDRFGVFGLRLATTLIRTGAGNRAGLAAELVRRSGLTELRESMARYFTDRREVLKARSALAALERVVHSDPRPGSADLLSRVEQVLASAHDFRELRLLATLRDPKTRIDRELSAEAHRLVGGNGTSLAVRLELDQDTDGGQLWEAGVDALYRWQAQADDPLLRPDQRRIARVVLRSVEGMLAELRGGWSLH